MPKGGGGGGELSTECFKVDAKEYLGCLMILEGLGGAECFI